MIWTIILYTGHTINTKSIVQAGEMHSEKSRFEETVGAMSEQLMDFVEKMNKLERECVSHIKKCYPLDSYLTIIFCVR